jgi:hypothetical protein
MADLHGHEDNRRGAEGTGSTEEPAMAEPGGTKITDAGLKELAGLKNLQTLHLNGTEITDAGLKELAGLKSLQVLSFLETGGTNVTDAGVEELRKALPKRATLVEQLRTVLPVRHTGDKARRFSGNYTVEPEHCRTAHSQGSRLPIAAEPPHLSQGRCSRQVVVAPQRLCGCLAPPVVRMFVHLSQARSWHPTATFALSESAVPELP